MACTTLLVGRAATNDGSTMIARNEDSGSNEFSMKRLEMIGPDKQPKSYTSVLGHLSFDLPDNPLAYSSMPDADDGHGIWAAAGINSENVAMTATETITTNVRVLAADPYVEYQPAADGKPEVPGGLSEEDFVTVVLPYVRSAREGAKRLGELLERWGTYESNGIAFSDANEIWWLETIGGHHWIAVRVPDDAYVVMPNQLGIDYFDLNDAFSEQHEYMCSPDLREFIAENHLNLDFEDMAEEGIINPRICFGSCDDADHVYNTPRAWDIHRTLAPSFAPWYSAHANEAVHPESDQLPFSLVPDRRLSLMDVKRALSMHYQGTEFDPYSGSDSAHKYRPAGINRTAHMSLLQIDGSKPKALQAVEWICFASNVHNVMIPFFTQVDKAPRYLSYTPAEPSTESFYWTSRMIAALSDPYMGTCLSLIENYQMAVGAITLRHVAETQKALAEKKLEAAQLSSALEEANQKICDDVASEASKVLLKVLDEASFGMKNSFSRDDV